MTLHDIDRIFRGWRRNPPPRMLLMAIASALGIKMPEPQSAEKPKYMNADDMRRLMNITGGKIAGLSPLPR